jgi:hypothetical protein
MRVPSYNSCNRDARQSHAVLRVEHRFLRVLGTILASAVAMRTSTSTCIRSKALRPRTIIDIHVSRSPKGTEGDQTTTGFRRTINLPGRQPPHRRCGKLKRLFVCITLSALRLLGLRPPQQSATERSPISVQEQQCQPCGHASQRRRTVRATKASACCLVGSAARTRPVQPMFVARASFQLCLFLDLGSFPRWRKDWGQGRRTMPHVVGSRTCDGRPQQPTRSLSPLRQHQGSTNGEPFLDGGNCRTHQRVRIFDPPRPL